MIQIVPAIIPESLEHLEGELSRVRLLARRVQIDICDGVFVTTKTWPYCTDKNTRFKNTRFDLVNKVEPCMDDDFLALTNESDGLPYWEDFDFEIDLMVKNPAAMAEAWIQAGASALIFHNESENIFPIVEALRQRFPLETVNGLELGLAINPSTKSDDIEKYISLIDFVQCMGSDMLGSHGVQLDVSVYDKINDIRNRLTKSDRRIGISVDIGVNLDTAALLVEAGATKLISGSTLFDSQSIADTILQLQNSDHA